jgi:hypothetical protein
VVAGDGAAAGESAGGRWCLCERESDRESVRSARRERDDASGPVFLELLYSV